MARTFRVLLSCCSVILVFCVQASAVAVPVVDADDDALNGRNYQDVPSSDDADDQSEDTEGDRGRGANEASQPPPQSEIYIASRELGADSKYRCEDLPEGDDEYWAAGCSIKNFSCQVADMVADEGEGYIATEQVRIDNRSGTSSEELLGFDCQQRAGTSGGGSDPVVITLTREDFESMPVEPLVASAGPADGWLPVNMVNVLYAEGEAQMMDMELLDTPVQVRATPVLYDWDLGDGNTLSTTKAGKPFPSEEVSATYRYEGWYDVTLTTTFSGEYSVDGGPWQSIDGTIEVASEPIGIFSKSLESRLVNPDVPVDEDEDPWIPERTAETEGRKDPDATHREI